MNIFKIVVVKVPLAAYQPSAVGIYWMTSGAMAVLLNLLLMEPRLKNLETLSNRDLIPFLRFRRLVRIPFLEQEPQRPYQQLRENFYKTFGMKTK